MPIPPLSELSEFLEKAVKNLQKARRQLNSKIEQFEKYQSTLVLEIEKVLETRERLARYEENIDIINRAKLDAQFQEYQQLDDADKSELTNEVLDKYNALVKHFSAYLDAKKDSDVVLVKQSCAEGIAHIDNSSEEMLTCIVRYNGLIDTASNLLLEASSQESCLAECAIEAKSVLHLYAVIHIDIASKFLLNERLAILAKVRLSGMLGESLMRIVKADLIHDLHEYFLKKEAGVSAGPLAEDMVNLYQYQSTDITMAQTINSLKDVYRLIQSSAINKTLIENLSTIEDGKANVQEIADQSVAKLIKVLFDNAHLSKDEVYKIYALPVDVDGRVALPLAVFKNIRKYIGRMDRSKQQYVPSRASLYSENEAGIVKWLKEGEESRESELSQFENYNEL